MSFALAPLLGLLVLVPAMVVLYVVLTRRRARRTAELAAQGFAPNAAARRMRRRRHVPFAFFLAGITLLLVAIARPQAAVSIPRREGTVILAFDVSNSMLAKDLKPTRMAAAKAAARVFVAKQPTSVKVGVVAFSDGAIATQQPTNDRKLVVAAIDRLTPSGATSLGQGIFTALNAIAGKPITIDPNTKVDGLDKVDIGFYGSSAIVLLTDGENTAGPKPADMAKIASLGGVKIFTVGIGSAEGTVVEIDGFNVATALNEELLGEIAKTTNGTYYKASDETSLAKVYGSIDLKWKSVRKHTEITGIFTGVSTLFMLVGAALSLVWFGRVV